MTVTCPQQVNGSEKIKIDALTISVFQCKHETKNITKSIRFSSFTSNKIRINIMDISLKNCLS